MKPVPKIVMMTHADLDILWQCATHEAKNEQFYRVLVAGFAVGALAAAVVLAALIQIP